MEPGEYVGGVRPSSNTTIIGLAPGVVIRGIIKIKDQKENIIIRNLKVQGFPCGSYDDCSGGDDAILIKNECKNIWLDHVDVIDGQDGNLDYVAASDLVTVSWSNFDYTYNKEHRFSNLIAGSNDEIQSRNKLRVTYQFCYWGERVRSRQPRGRFGKVHMLNCYHQNDGNLYGVGVEMSVLAEGCYYDNPDEDVFYEQSGDGQSWKGQNNEGNARRMNDVNGVVFTPLYSYGVIDAEDARDAIVGPNGAGSNCVFDYNSS